QLANFTTNSSITNTTTHISTEKNSKTISTNSPTSSEENAPTSSSIHLSFRPLANKRYINEELINEIATVRKIIKLALFVRAKNKIAVKQPLQKLEINID
ncbi:MAG: hypothetical protein LBG52_04515, partial [Candidatus Peribacteria bacterium]|nr:hypothetical protein [Candidatus Peribacteria bacterium]